MPINTNKVNQKVTVLTGEVLFEEGSPCDSLNILHKGSLLLEKKIENRNIPLIKLTGSHLTPGILNLIQNSRYSYTIKAIEDSLISTYQGSSSSIEKTITTKLSLGVMIAKTLLKEISETFKKNNHIRALSAQLTKFSDNLSIVYYQLAPSFFPDINPQGQVDHPSDDVIDPILRLTRENLHHFLYRGGRLPEPPTANFLFEDRGALLLKEYIEEIEIDDKEFFFIRKILITESKVQNPLFEADPSILVHICTKLTDVLKSMLDKFEEESQQLNQGMEMFFAPEKGMLEKYYQILQFQESGISETTPEILSPMTEFISDKINGFLNMYRNIFSFDYFNISPNVNDFQERARKLANSLKAQAKGTQEGTIVAGINIESVKKDLEGSALKIMTFAKLSPEKVKEFSSLLIKFKTMKNPLDPEPDARKIRRNITKTYWEIYENCFAKYMNDKNIPKPVELMLKYGFFDETLLEDNQFIYLYTLEDKTRNNPIVPAHSGIEWLESIYQKKIVTSIDEMGQTYFEKIKMSTREVNYKRESDVPPEVDTSLARLQHELVALYAPNARLTTGSPASHVPILTKYHIVIPLDKCFVTKKQLSDTLEEIMHVDVTAFNREVIYNDEELGILKEFVQKQIIPDFILVPSIGGKIMMWQDLSVFRGSGAKESRGRIVLPIFVTGDLKTMLMEAIAAFRWELCKSILGADWNNVGIPSITADYTDYVQFFKKSRDLSIEVKEKLAVELKRFRNDRDKFVHDYLHWIKYESDGVPRVNKVVRNMFYRHIPFSKEVRDRVSKLPAFAEIHNRFTNIRKRQYRELENKYKKYSNQTGFLPKVLQDNLDFYKV
ncbi:MAG: cyclic nucleotide-binding domain-containing protein [Leptospiraceae bacterium]|nr:cyclic nucleotide-binding domain-containing protein [Leptospiraceae bacterium]MCP5497197.1 cyclic nucleotide-binding domain-containing protein [Leptospiraceae bacterium]